ncbi:hypothetical protein PybrP1_007348 [[Pythium] brassicae (nom. inval.)]|nr:hypothetical protein PybrP1_007348 [[Pythium] brassicae (nom. inval.)]
MDDDGDKCWRMCHHGDDGVDAAAAVVSSSGEHYPSTKLTFSGNRPSATSSDDFSKPSPSTNSPPPSTTRASALQTLRMTLRRTKSQRCSISTTGTSVVTVANEDDVDGGQGESATRSPRQWPEHQRSGQSKQHAAHQEDDEEDIAMLQPEEEEGVASSETRARRWRRSFSNIRMAISRSASGPAAKKGKAAPNLYSISFYPWKRDPRAYYSNPEAAAEWVPDTASKRCQICLASFNLTRRRHHCRICGLLACSDCSLQRTYFPFSKDSRSQHHLIKDGAPQRTCNACAGTLHNMAAQSDPRVKLFTVRPPATNLFGVRDGDNGCDGGDDGLCSWRVSNGVEDIYVVDSGKSSARVQLALELRGTSQAQSDELDEVLRARAQSRKNPQPKYYVVNSIWLEQWLQYVHIDAPPTSHGIPSRRHRSTTGARAPRNARRPGPIANYALLNFVSGKLLPKHGLARSRGNDAGGDYRIVSEEVWSVFLGHYGGGPCIQLRLDDGPSPPPTTATNQHALVRKQSTLNEGTGSGLGDACRWVIVEIDDTIPPLIASEPADLLKGNKNMRRVVSATALNRRHGSSMRLMSSVHPFHETAPCVLRDADERPQQQQQLHDRQPRHDTAPCFLRDAGERSLPYYPRSSAVNCITSPVSTGGAQRSQVRHLDQHQLQRQSTTMPTTTPKTAQRTELLRPRTASLSSTGAAVSTVSVGAVLYKPATTLSEDANSDREHSPRATIAAVSAFALAAAEARKKSAMSLSRHSSALSSSMVKAHSSSASA